jgi:hypothetical protein
MFDFYRITYSPPPLGALKHASICRSIGEHGNFLSYQGYWHIALLLWFLFLKCVPRFVLDYRIYLLAHRPFVCIK